MIRVALSDDHAVVRQGLRQILSAQPDFTVVAEASNHGETLQMLRNTRCDVLVLDIAMPGRSGIDTLKQVKNEWPKLPVLMLSMYPEQQYALVAVQAGASGYVAKDAEPSELVQAIRRVAAGGQYLSVAAARTVLDQLRGLDRRPPHERLSIREHQIMVMIVRGMSVTAIADEMALSVKTVSRHRSNLLEKIGVASTAELVLYAVRHGLVH